MTPEQFCYWIQGFVEIRGGYTPSGDEWKVIKDHLELVFEKRTPNYNIPGAQPSKTSKELLESFERARDALKYGGIPTWPTSPLITC